jgi:hypothetical protein
MNKNGWANLIFIFLMFHIGNSMSSISVWMSDLPSIIVFILVEFGVAFYINGILLDRTKAEHFKHIDDPNHWSHKAYQTYFVDENLTP